MREPRNRDNGASDVWALTAYIQQNSKTYTANPLCKLCKKLCKVVYYMNHTTQLCGSYSTQLYTTLHNGFAV